MKNIENTNSANSRTITIGLDKNLSRSLTLHKDEYTSFPQKNRMIPHILFYYLFLLFSY